MPNHGGNQGGKPTKLMPAVRDQICADVCKGVYATVAGARADVSQFALYLWNQRDKREAEQREERRIKAEMGERVGDDLPPSSYKQLHLALEAATQAHQPPGCMASGPSAKYDHSLVRWW